MSSKGSILIVDDEPNIRLVLQAAFEKAGYKAFVAEDAPSALDSFEKNNPDCVLTDVTMPGRSGYELLRDIMERKPDTPVVIMTAYGTIPQAIQSIREGAYEYVTKPFDLDALKRIIASAFESKSQGKIRLPKAGNASAPAFIAESPAMKEISHTIQQVADTRATVMIGGESGVGKEVIARALHSCSMRSSKSFVAVSCAALPETLLESELFGHEKGAFTGADKAKPGRFEIAHEGTLFLDEIGEVPPAVQVKLLRVLQEREIERLGSGKPTKVDVRVVTATNRNLRDAVAEGVFRLDLLYRLQVIEIVIPPLRDRVDDILPLAHHFLSKYCNENSRETMSIEHEAERLLLQYRWPGNVRELENVIERAVVLATGADTTLNVALLPAPMKKAA
jgi:DNA-binding NtrC family response regulator